MNETSLDIPEGIQVLAAKLLVIHPEGHKLCLIGGFRYRLLNASARRSVDHAVTVLQNALAPETPS